MTERIWILGPSPDPEMEAIEGLLREAGERIIYARADSAYRVAALSEPIPAGATVYRVECDGPAIPADAIVIDHHRPGDPGYGRPPAEFLPASSIGQVIAELARLGRLPAQWRIVLPASQCRNRDADGQVNFGAAGWVVQTGWIREPSIPLTADGAASGGAALVQVPYELVLAAAADHCLAAAYRGECPGVDPDALMRWRAARLLRIPSRDREGECFIAAQQDRIKVVCQSDAIACVRADDSAQSRGGDAYVRAAVSILWARKGLFIRGEIEQDANYRNCPYTVIPFDAMASRVDRPDLLPQKPFVLINRHGDDIAYGEEHELSVIAAHWNEKGARTVMTEGTAAEGL